jgi:hypothetical protein
MKPKLLIFPFILLITFPLTIFADGMVVPPIQYKGSLNETAQEAILIFHKGTEQQPSSQDMILKITVQGETKDFGWVVPLPSVPDTGKADAAMFQELHDYVQARQPRRPKATPSFKNGLDQKSESAPAAVVIKREIVGSYDVAIVREKKDGGLKDWLKDNEFKTPENVGDLIAFYRKKGYVFACMKVSDAELTKGASADLHPIRFRFTTGGRDGIFFPMRMTGLQKERFNLNLYVFYNRWGNDRLSRFGYMQKGLSRRWRDYDSRSCKPNAGKLWSNPSKDPYLKNYARIFPTVTEYMKENFPNNRYYLTNVYANNLNPKNVLDWEDDLWMFPYYTDKRFVPYDAREGGPAAYGY